MAFLVSPGVEVKEKDLTNIIPAVATAIGGVAGVFEWGPAKEVTLVSSEADLISKFGYPKTSSNAASNSRLDWYAAANYLSYSNALQTVRVLPSASRNAVSETTPDQPAVMTVVVSGTVSSTGTIAVPYNGGTTVTVNAVNSETASAVATKLGAALTAAGVVGVTVTDTLVEYTATGYARPVQTVLRGITTDYMLTDAVVGSTSAAQIANFSEFLTEAEGLSDGSVYARYPGVLGNSIGVMLIDAGAANLNATIGSGNARLSDYFDDVPSTSVWAQTNINSTLNDEVHVVVYTTDTKITGTANDVLETYAFLSKIKNAKTADSGPNYYVDVINNSSKWIYIQNEQTYATSAVTAGTHSIGATLNGTQTGSVSAFITNTGTAGIRRYNLTGGTDGTTVSDADYTDAYAYLADVEMVDVSLLITSNRSKDVQKYVIENIAEVRKDCVAFVSPDYQAAVNNPTAAKIVEYFNSTTDGFNSTSYAVFDSGWKRQYDRYNDEYFWIPLNADIAGVTARTDLTNDAWWSPAGLNRGFIKNSVKLSYNPNQTDRDSLYTKRINPVVTLRGQGTLLFGDKTALSRPSAFDRINVRRLFIILEKAIATASKYQLFEFNDDFTRRSFVNAVEPFLADVKTRRGIFDYKVVCDTSNNTGEVIDGNRFVADIYIKPARSINFITLNFVAVRTGVDFNEVVGA